MPPVPPAAPPGTAPPFPPPSAPSTTFSTYPHPPPLWFCDLTTPSSTGAPIVLTHPLPPWASAFALAPQNVSMIKARSYEQGSSGKFLAFLQTISSTPGQVSPTYPRILQCLVDQLVGFYSMSGGGCTHEALNGEVWRFLSDAFSHSSCPDRIMVSYRESESSFNRSSSAGPTNHFERLVAHVISAVIRELLPAHEASTHISFNNQARLMPGDTVLDFANRIRRCATANSVDSATARMRMLTCIQDARSHPNVDRAVQNEVSKKLHSLVQHKGEFSAFVSDIQALSEIGGYLSEPIIPTVQTPPLNFIAGPPAPKPVPTPTVLPPAPHVLQPAPLVLPPPTPPGSSAGSFLAERGPKRAYDLSRIYPLLLPNEAIPELRKPEERRGEPWDCAVCRVIFGMTLIPWTADAPKPTLESKTKFAHDPWFCYKVGSLIRAKRMRGDTRFTDELCNGLEQKPQQLEGFQTGV